MRFKLTLILIIIFGLLFGYVYLYELDEPVDQQTAEVQNITKLDAGKITGLELSSQEGKINLKKEEGKWLLTAPRELDGDQDEIEDILESSLKSDRVVVDNTDEGNGNIDLAKYGLDNTESKFLIMTENGNEITINIGNETPVSGGYYLRKNKENKVYRITSSQVSKIKKDVDDFYPAQW